MAYKTERLQETLRDLVAQDIERHTYTSDAMVTVLDVLVDDKREYARINIAVFPDEQKEKVLEELNKHAPKIRYAIMKKSAIGRMPRMIVFE